MVDATNGTTFTSDGHSYTYTFTEASFAIASGYELEVFDVNSESIGTITVDHSFETIEYLRDTGDGSSLNYYEFSEMDDTVASLVSWLAGTSY